MRIDASQDEYKKAFEQASNDFIDMIFPSLFELFEDLERQGYFLLRDKSEQFDMLTEYIEQQYEEVHRLRKGINN